MKSKLQIVILGIFSCLLVTTYTSFSYIITFIYQNEDVEFKEMGPLLLFSNYFVFLVTNSLAPGFNIKLKNQLMIAAICYTANYGLELVNIQETNFGIFLSVIGACAGGFGAAVFWVCYGAYTKSLCTINNEQQVQGKYFGILGGITFLSSIIGPVITTFALGFFSTKIYFGALFILGAISLLFCYLFIKDVDYVHKIVKHDSFIDEFKQNCSYYVNMKATIIVLLLDGLALGFISSSVSKLLPNSEESSLLVGIYLIVLGIGSTFGSLISGYFSDAYKMINVGRSAIMAVMIACVYSLMAIRFKNTIVSYIGAFIWGFILQYLEGWIYIVCSRNFNGDLQAFANSKQLHSLAFCFYQIYLIISKDSLPLEYTILAMMILAFPSFIFLKDLPKPNLNEAEKISGEDSN